MPYKNNAYDAALKRYMCGLTYWWLLGQSLREDEGNSKNWKGGRGWGSQMTYASTLLTLEQRNWPCVS